MPLLDLAPLLRPIPGPDPCGAPLRDTPLHDALRELRREEDAEAPRGVWRRKLKAADWPAVIATAGSALAEDSKDLQLAAWLAEALAARHGLAGAVTGLDLLTGLVARYWPGLWPRPAEAEDAEEDARVTILEWLDARLSERLMLQPMTEVGEPPPTWHEHASLQRRRAVAHGRLPPEDEERGSALAKTIARTPDAMFRATLEEVGAVRRAEAALVAALRAAGLAEPPAFPQLGGMLDAMQAFLHAELTGRGALAETLAPVAPLAAPPEPEPAAPPPETPEAMPEAAPSPAARGPIASRDAAYRQLEEVARYLEAVEPHSPVPALLRRAIRWGEMRLPDLLAELMQEEGGPFRLLRITPDASPGR